MLKVQKFEVNMFGVNTYVVYNPDTSDAVIIDPGFISPDEVEQVDRFIRGNSLKPDSIVNTHLHLDHIFGVNDTKRLYGIKLQAHASDAPLGLSLADQIQRFHLPLTASAVAIDVELNDGDCISIGNDELHVLAVPGHSPGGLAFYSPTSRFVITGDSLFRGSIGRTDLPGGNHAQLIDSLHSKLLSLPEDTVVYPGHGPESTIGTEKIYNPYC